MSETQAETRGMYRHPYGGWAWDILVKRDRFARLFGIHVSTLPQLAGMGKVANLTYRDRDDRLVEVLGYVERGPRGGLKFRTTYVRH